MNTTIGKRDFLHHASQYLKEIEASGRSIVIATRGVPSIKISPITQNAISHLRGIIKKKEGLKNINDPILPEYDQW